MPNLDRDQPAALRRGVKTSIAAGRLSEARDSLERLLEQLPDDHDARLELAQVLLGLGRLRDAVDTLYRIESTCPDDAVLLAKLAPMLQWNGEVNAARHCLDRLERIPAQSPGLLYAQATMRWRLGEIEVANDAMERAMAAGADSPDAWYLQALLQQFTGRLDAAESSLRSCLQRWPGFGSAAVVLANLRRHSTDSGMLAWFEDLRSRLPSESTSPQATKVHAEYASARFKILDDLGRTDEAWTALERSNSLMRSLFPYDAGAEAAITDLLIEMADLQEPAPAGASLPDGPMPIFIVGLPRSGSTLLERMLSAHSRVVAAGEINDFLCQVRWMADVPPRDNAALMEVVRRSAEFDARELGMRYLEQTRWRAGGGAYFVDKMLTNIRLLPLIRRALPDAPILHMVRDPMDVCFSNLKIMFGASSPHTYGMQEMAHYHAQYQRLVQHYRDVLPDAMLEVRYEELIRDPEETMLKVLAHCGLQAEPACLRPERNPAPVATRSSVQVREAINERGIGGWKRYAGKLDPLRQALRQD